MKKLAEIEPVQFFSKFKDKKRSQLIISLAKKYLDENQCYLRTGKIFHIVGLRLIDNFITKDQEIIDLKQVCQECPFINQCSTNY